MMSGKVNYYIDSPFKPLAHLEFAPEAKAEAQEQYIQLFKQFMVEECGYTNSLAQLCEDALSHLAPSYCGELAPREHYAICFCLQEALGIYDNPTIRLAVIQWFCNTFCGGDDHPFSWDKFLVSDSQQARALWLTMLGQYFEDEGL